MPPPQPSPQTLSLFLRAQTTLYGPLITTTSTPPNLDPTPQLRRAFRPLPLDGRHRGPKLPHITPHPPLPSIPNALPNPRLPTHRIRAQHPRAHAQPSPPIPPRSIPLPPIVRRPPHRQTLRQRARLRRAVPPLPDAMDVRAEPDECGEWGGEVECFSC